MMKTIRLLSLCLILSMVGIKAIAQTSENAVMQLQHGSYLGTRGFDVMVFNDIYPEGHQGGIEIIKHGERVAANGDLRLEPTLGNGLQFQNCRIERWIAKKI